MSWTSPEVTQRGNTTRIWTATGPALSTHDNVVVGLTAASPSTIRLNWVEVGVSPTRYLLNVQVVGPDPVAFRVYAEQMD